MTIFAGDYTTTTLLAARGVTDADVCYGVVARVGGVLYRAASVGTAISNWKRIPVSGAWTGAAVAGTNVASIGNVTGVYSVIGDTVFLSGAVASVDPTAGAPTATDFDLPIPIASDFAAATDAHGIAMGSVFTAGVVTADATDNRLTVTGSFSANTTISIYVNAAYTLL